MKYYIQRGLSEYGPYTLAELQQYVAQGNILLTDLCRGEGMTEWAPVSQVIGNIPVPAPLPVPADAGTVYSAPQATNVAYAGAPAYGAVPTPAASGPVPPDFHWALVLVISWVSCGIFQLVWLVIEAAFVRKIRPGNKGMGLIIGGLVAQVGCFVVLGIASAAAQGSQDLQAVVGLLFLVAMLAGAVLYIVGVFTMRSGLLEYYNTVEPIHLRLSGVMTFFFSTFYFQHHLSRIAKWKNTGYLEPQQ
jgi:GYF domain 2